MESAELDPSICENLVYNEGGISNHWGKHVLYFFFSLNIYGFYLTYISTYNIHTENTSGHQRTFISCIPSDDVTHDFESYWMKDVPGSISHLSPQVAGDQRISSLWTTRSCTALPHNVSFLMKTKNGFQEPC